MWWILEFLNFVIDTLGKQLLTPKCHNLNYVETSCSQAKDFVVFRLFTSSCSLHLCGCSAWPGLLSIAHFLNSRRTLRKYECNVWGTLVDSGYICQFLSARSWSALAYYWWSALAPPATTHTPELATASPSPAWPRVETFNICIYNLPTIYWQQTWLHVSYLPMMRVDCCWNVWARL